jgi:hypothetical protein
MPIWELCSSHSQLFLMSRLLNIKSENTVPKKYFNQVVQLMKKVASDTNKIPDDLYEMKKLVSKLGFPIQKIYACTNRCILYWKGDDASIDCKFCGHPRYMQKSVRKGSRQKVIPFKKIYYFPISLRLQRLYASKKTAPHVPPQPFRLSRTGPSVSPCLINTSKGLGVIITRSQSLMNQRKIPRGRNNKT